VDRASGSGNGFETVRIGYSHQQDNMARVTFERNLFLRQNGENEIISNKSSGNFILRNTFQDNNGEMTCRHGDKARIEGNFFLRQDRGVRLIGSDHVVINNYIADMKTDGIILYSGESNPEPTGYEAATNPLLAFNTIVNCPTGVVVGSGKAVAPKNVRIANNAFLLPSGNAVRIDQGPSGITYEGNLWQGKGAGVSNAGLKQADLKLVKGADGIWRPEAGTAVKDAAAGTWADILLDFDGADRGTAKDVGAFEYGAEIAKRKPLTEKDVGPWWLGNTSTPENGGPIAVRFQPRGKTWREAMEPGGLAEARDFLGRSLGSGQSRAFQRDFRAARP
jgi:poly(beta-D-mannuronate) lyase